MTISPLIETLLASTFVRSLPTQWKNVSPSDNPVDPVSCGIHVSEVIHLTSHLAVSTYAAVRGDCWGHNSGNIDVLG